MDRVVTTSAWPADDGSFVLFPFVYGPARALTGSNTRTVTFRLVGADGLPLQYRTIRAYVIGNRTAESGAVIAGTDVTAVTDSNGDASLSLIVASAFTSPLPAGTGRYRVNIQDWGSADIQVPAGSGTVAFDSLVTS